jgi:3,4-dihydroxy 2-butanone 4-phosphate synthase/GTP cyclohydrolase II
MRLIAAEGRGVLVLLRDLTMKLARGRRGLAADAAAIRAGRADPARWGCRELILLTNSPKPKVVGLEAYGLSRSSAPARYRSWADGRTFHYDLGCRASTSR